MIRPLLEQALKEMSRHHDALRLRYVRDSGRWRQFYAGTEEALPFAWTNLAGLNAHEKFCRLEETAAATQSGLNLASGPLWRAEFFEMGDGQPGRLLLVVHHLAVDGISWQPLLEDLETAYQQLQSVLPVQLPTKTASFRTWAERLRQFAASDSLHDELPYWNAVTDPERTAVSRLLPASSDAPTLDTEGSAVTWKNSLTEEETQALLQRVPAAYNTQINDCLLTALARAWNLWSGSRTLYTNLEGHGREDLFDDVDLSRTVGWFTSIFPVLLELPNDVEGWRPGEALKSVKEQLRQIPRRGVGYGILRYLNADSGLASRPEPAMVVNYLGQFDQVLAGSRLFRFAPESSGPWHSPRQRRRHALELNSLVIDGRLELRWTYSPSFCAESAVQPLFDAFSTALRELISHCLSPEAGGRTPADFPLARLDQPALDRLVGSRLDIEDVYPLSPIQTLFLSSNPGVAQSGFDQWQCTLCGDLSIPVFQDAWRETLRRHSILRTTIHSEGLPDPVQMVHRDVRPHWTLEDWREVPVARHAECWSDFLRRDRSRPLMRTEAPVMRFALLRLC